MIGIAKSVMMRPGQENVSPSPRHRPQAAAAHVSRQQEQEAAGNAARSAFDAFCEGATLLEFARQAPDQNAGRHQLDHAVRAESHQTEAASADPSADRHGCLDHHPDNRQPFQPERFPDQRLTRASEPKVRVCG
jgi:hypothetical protein